MRKKLLARLLILSIVATNLSGCIIWPWWEDDGRGYRHGEYEHGGHGGEHHEEHGGYGERR